MNTPAVYDSRDPFCKKPYGALRCGETWTLTTRPLSSDGFTHCSVILHREFAGHQIEVELPFSGFWEDRACFSLTFQAFQTPELVWYWFRFWRDDGSGCVLDRTGFRGLGDPQPWQLTVYEESHTPAWFGEGVTYQIFPDRYCRLSMPDPEGLPGNRWVHENWDEAPAWMPEGGEVKNRDFFGGSLAGIAAHLEDLAALGVSTLYLCPIFESASNHRYNTADYTKIDPMLGTERDFRDFCAQARARGIRVVLDGVFNHTGSQSIYFNADGFYPTLGAAQSRESPYYDWFQFSDWPGSYDAWWGISTLPNVREDCPSYVDYIIEGENSIVKRWLRAGASGWRLDVADELPDRFIEKLRAAVEETDPGALVLGEVWEDASNKISYSRRRKYLLGKELHGVMNYPFRTALLAYLMGGGAEDFQESMETLRENYPPAAFRSALNFLGTHDTPRILTVFSGCPLPEGRDAQSVFRLTPQQREVGLARLHVAAAILFTFPGSPMIYYGDEAGMEGAADPFNRGTYPWGHEDQALLSWFTRLGQLRKNRASLRRGDIRWLAAQGPLLAYIREVPGEDTITLVNAGPDHWEAPLPGEGCRDLLTGEAVPGGTAGVPPYSVRLLGRG
ncbi:glycoside hydrolase family 13 protein [Oscillospiraceae bacterium 38-13]